MHTFRIEFANSKETPVFVQVDPWACLYKLEKDERIEFAMVTKTEDPWFSVDELDENNRILTLWNCDEFFIILDGKRVHWEDYQTNA